MGFSVNRAVIIGLWRLQIGLWYWALKTFWAQNLENEKYEMVQVSSEVQIFSGARVELTSCNLHRSSPYLPSWAAMATLSWWRATPSAAVPTATKAVHLPPPSSKVTNWASFRGKEYEKLIAKARGSLINSQRDSSRKKTGNSVRCQAAAEQKMTHEGSITESLPNGMFRVRLDNEDVILGYISGKIRKNFIRLLPGDRVRVEVSRYDSSRGRIIFRLRGRDPN